jgi:hypothetical protein
MLNKIEDATVFTPIGDLGCEPLRSPQPLRPYSAHFVLSALTERPRFQTASLAHPSFYPAGTGGSFTEVKRPECEADHSLPSSAEEKNVGIIPPLPHTSAWRRA